MPLNSAQTEQRGILLALLAFLIFASQDAITRVLVQDYSVGQIMMLRQFAFLGFALWLVSHRQGIRRALRSQKPRLQFLRSACWWLSVALFAVAVRYMELADAHAIEMTAPLITTLLAVPILGEKLGPKRLTAVFIAFIGMLLILRPGQGVFGWVALLPLGAGITYSLYTLLTRLLSQHDTFEVSLLYLGLVSAALSVMWGMPTWQWPDLDGWILLLTLCVTGTSGHALLMKSLEFAPASLLQPFNYTVLVWGVLFGYLIFNDLPDAWTLCGAAIVVSSGLYVWARERQIKNLP